MKSLLQWTLTGLGCMAIGVVIAYWFMPGDLDERTRPETPTSRTVAKDAEPQAYPSPALPTFPDPTAPPGSSDRVFIDPQAFDSLILAATAQFTDKVKDEGSLREYREVISHRADRAKAQLQASLKALHLDPTPSRDQALQALWVYRQFAFVALYEGDHDVAAAWLERSLELSRTPGVPTSVRANMMALLGINALRRGEQDNCIGCVGPSSCIFPIAPAAVHTQPSGSREAVRWFSAYLDEWPGDLRIRWLLNIAAMTLGDYPEKVPPRFRIAVEPFRSKRDLGRFENVATLVGLIARGPDLAGGCIFDDFNGDGRPDILTTSFDVANGASLYVNRGDGRFEDRSSAAGLDEQVYALNLTRADFDNDGRLDVLLLRGAWEKPARMSLLRNKGDGVFEDVTVAAGLGVPISSESAAFGDYDNDGRLDLFVCGEYRQSPDPESAEKSSNRPNPRNHCRLYHNQGDGTFVDVAEKAGVWNDRWAKGSAWGDYDNDGRIDLFVSNMEGPARLYRNLGDGTFVDVAPELRIVGPPHGFTCMFLDYDNDDRLDILIGDYSSNLSEVVADYLGLPVHSEDHAYLYHNLGPDGFREVSREAGLARPMPVMSLNAGDIDNDGDLDLHFGTGWMSLSGLVPDLMYENVDGRFEDVTDSTATGHLQKGHGVSFADWDDDGDLDLFVVLGGGYPGDRGYNALFQNPGHKRHWLKVKLIGTKTNKSALGAKLRVDLTGPGGTRSIHRVIGNNGSFGGNTLVESIGLLDAKSVDRLTVTWPTSKTTQTFEHLDADQAIEITEGIDQYKVVTRAPLTRPSGTLSPQGRGG
ncbi:MAG: FG-GAP-like repeat-containing protein [Isosphaeraceae bacterium]